MDFLDKQIPPPRDWAKFEDLTRALFAAIYDNPLAAKNGRQGQAQHGVDVFVEHPVGSGEWIGVQCKGKDGRFGAKATTAEFDEELAKAEGFRPPLKRWIFVTTAQDDQNLQKHARTVSTARVKGGGFAVDILGWDSLLAHIAQHEEVIREFYPEQLALSDDLERLHEDGRIAVAGMDDVLHHAGTSLTLLRSRIWKAADEALTDQRIVRLVGEGGSGKTGLVRRLAERFECPSLVLRDNRISARSLSSHLAQLGVTSPVSALLEGMAKKGPSLIVIDGADRLLTSERREVVLDLLREIAASPHREDFRILASARAYQDREAVADALAACGFAGAGRRIDVGTLDDEECAELSRAFGQFSAVLGRRDLGGQNRSLFLIRELLKRDAPPTGRFGELDVAEAWATGDWVSPGKVERRGRALAEMGERLLDAPQRPVSRASLDPEGLRTLLEEGAISAVPGTDAVRFTHDVHEDWLIARRLAARRGETAAVLAGAGEPLWWLKAIGLLARGHLESGDREGWAALLADLDAAPDLDPSWSRAVLSAPLRSEGSSTVLDALEDDLLAEDAGLLRRMLDTLLVFETALDENVLNFLADRDEATRYRIAAYWRQPKLAAWAPFLHWSLPKWESWPASLVSRLSEISGLFARAMARMPNGLSQRMARIALSWLTEIEDAEHPTDWNDRRDPFGLELAGYDAWEKIGDRLRETVANCARSSPDSAREYLVRLAAVERLREERRKLLEDPGILPELFPHEWADMCIAQFVPPRRRTYRDGVLGPQLFSWLDHNTAGLRGERETSPSSPLRAGFDQLFRTDEAEALRVFHALERRASVSWRWFMKCHDGKRPIPLVIDLGHREVRLWGYDAVYRWARGVLGPHALGSAYLALDDWLEEQAAAGRPVAELIDLVLADHGLVATASPLLGLMHERVNEEGVIDAAAPFLARPRLWEYDIRRHLDDQGSAHRIGYFNCAPQHVEAIEANYRRHAARRPLHHALLLPFRLMAGGAAQEMLEEARLAWTHEDLADFREELGVPELVEERSARIERYRSDADRSRITFESAEEGISVSITPPDEVVADIEEQEEASELTGRAMALSNWVRKTREDGSVADGFTVEGAIEQARRLAEDLETQNEHIEFARRLGGSAIVGTAAVAARHLDDAALGHEREWVTDWLLHAAGAGDREDMIPSSMLFDDFQDLAAWGIAALVSREPQDARIDAMAARLAVHRLDAVCATLLAGLDWDRRPDLVRRLHVAALDTCVIHVGWWWRDAQREKALRRTVEDRRGLAASVPRIGLERPPRLPPPPHGRRLIWTGKWPLPAEVALMPAKRMLDWTRAPALFKVIDWARIVHDEEDRARFSRYFAALAEWTRLYSEDTERFDRQFPYEWAHELARTMGRFAFTHGGDEWTALTRFGYRDRPEDLIGEYLDALATALVESGGPPDEGFWSAWRPAARWLIDNAMPKRRGSHDHLPQGLTAAGMMGPYMTPLPPDWPHLGHVLKDIDVWVRETAHLPAAAVASLAIVERMDVPQRSRYFVAWLQLWVAGHGSDETFWSYAGLGDRAAAYLRPLRSEPQDVRRAVRRILGILADAGGTAARELIADFADGR
ncbi:hypothetical protein [Qipengyuania sp.]|uniref:hypothetical protein n=1 Tax=Qipengyuania sp. TaxID=2004515 RepID=UPI003AF5502C